MGDLALLVSRSCTTGWADWIHGELWLTPTGLVRRRLSLALTIANGVGPTVPSPSPAAPAADLDLAGVLAGHRTNKVIPFDEVDRATLHRGRMAHGLTLVMVNGRRHKLLWLTGDHTYGELSRALPDKLGTRMATR